MLKEKIKVKRGSLVAQFVPGTYNAERHTIDVVWTTGARGLRMNYITGELFYEELEVSEKAIRMGRLQNKASVLNTHKRDDLIRVMGVVDDAWIQDAKGLATVRFSQRSDVNPYEKDVADGIITKLSCCYTTFRYEKVGEEDGIPIYRATDWEPDEISFVPVAFDDQSMTRSAEPQSCVEVEVSTRQAEHIHPDAAAGGPIPHKEERAMKTCPQCGASVDETLDTCPQCGASMTEERSAVQSTNTPATAPAPQGEATAERSRVTEILRSVRAAGLPETVADKMIADGVTVEAARAAVIDELAKRQAPTVSARGISVTRDQADNRRQAMGDALLLRWNPNAQAHGLTPAQVEAAREFRGMTLTEMAREALNAIGVNTRGMQRHEVAAYALNLTRDGGQMSTSDFPNILANVANKVLRQAYQQTPRTFLPIARQASASDFKSMLRVQLGEAPKLEKVNESGEFQYGKVGEAAESYKLETYGKIVTISRQTIINDDLQAFTRLPQLFGSAAANLESDIVWGLITGNPNMADNVALFHANHGNLAGAGAAISVATLGAARAAMRVQKGIDGATLLNIAPAYLIVPAALETTAQQFLGSTQIYATKNSDVNPFAGLLTPIAEPRLDANSATAWYLAANPGQIDVIEFAYLEGQDGVYLETQQGFDVDGLQIKARLDFGAKVLDHRGLYKNAGV